MRDEDVLITEYRVTVLGERGQYVFDWVDEDASTVEFVRSESDFDDYSNEVRDLLQRNGVSIVESDQEVESQSGQSLTPTSRPDPIDGTNPDSKPTEASQQDQDSNDDFKPTDSESTADPIGSTEPTNKKPSSDSSTDAGSTTSNHSTSDQTHDEQAEKETHSFIVRMSDPRERRKIIDKIRPDNPGAADELELSGPFRVTYKMSSNGIELVHVEDLGTGTSVGEE